MPRKQPAAQLWRRFIAIFFFLGVLSVASHLVIEWLIVGNEHSNAVVNVAGRQRMLSQQIALLAERLGKIEDRQDYDATKTRLLDAVALMEHSHAALIAGDEPHKIPAERSPEVEALYFGPKSHVDQDVKRFIEYARAVASVDFDGRMQIEERNERVFRMAGGDFIADLDQVVRQYQIDGEKQVHAVKLLGIVSLVIFLLTLIALAATVFRPMVRRVHSEFEAREKSERLLLGSERRQRTIVESALDGVITIDHGGRIVEFNPSALTMFGYKQLEDIKGRDLGDIIIPPEYRTAHQEGIARVLATGSSKTLGKRIEVSALRSNGDTFPVELTVAGYVVGDEQFFTAFLRDLSDEKQREQERAELESQLRQSQKMETMGTLAGGIAHDFNNVLMPIVGYVELMLRKVNQESDLHKSLSRVLKAAEKATNLVRQIMTFSRHDPTEKTVFLVPPLLFETVELMRAATTTRIEFRKNIATDLPPIFADPSRVQQVVMNLCTNAVQAMGDKPGVLSLTLERVFLDGETVKTIPGIDPGSYLKLAVGDTGVGMAEDVKDKVFEPFFTTKRLQGGTGLGLAICHSIVAEMNGFIRVESEVSQGTTFTVYLPTTDTPLSAEAETGQESLEGVGRILVIDDVAENVGLISEMLKILGYEAQGFSNSVDALAYFRTHVDDIDLIFTDQEMPDMTGDILAEAVKKIRPEIPVILATGYSEKLSGRDPKALGFDDILFKPVTLQVLGKAIKKSLGGSGDKTLN